MSETASAPQNSLDWSVVWGMLREHRARLVAANGLALIGAAATTLMPLLFPLLVDEVLLDQPGWLVGLIQGLFPSDWHGATLYIGAVLAFTLVLRLLALAVGVLQSRLFVQMSKDVTFRLRSRLLERLRRVSMSELETLGGGRVSSNLVVDLSTIESFVGTTLSRTILSIFIVATVGVILLWLHWPLALFILFLNPFVLLFSRVFRSKVKALQGRENAAFEAFQQALQETLDAMQQIRASNREQHYVARLIDRARAVREHGTAMGWKSNAAMQTSRLVYMFGFDVFRAAAMLMVVFSDLTVGEVFAVFSYLWFMMTPVQELIGLQFARFGASAALGRLGRLDRLQLEPRFEHLENPFEGRTTVGLRIEDLRFAYGSGPPVLKGLDLEIAAGETVAFVGASGGGKSTLVQAVLGLYPPQGGMIFFDGVPIDRIGLDVVRQNVATVLQRPAMLHASVRENLCLGHEHTDTELWDALELAQARAVVEAMDQKLETPIGLHGVRISGGQRQRLAIARMILADPAVIILDEATSAIDLETEAMLFRALTERFDDRTMIIVAHRLSSLRYADRVCVFEDGRVSAQGSHDALVVENELYGKLYGAPR